MLDHISLPVDDLEASARFYDAVLAPLGYRRGTERVGAVGYSRESDRSPGFWLLARASGSATPGLGLHVCFSAGSHAQVHAFHEAALALGAKNGGSPGARPHYSDHFYGGFVFDPDGFKIEATCRGIPIEG